MEDKGAAYILKSCTVPEDYSAEEKKKAAQACSVLVRGSPDKPLAAVLKSKKDREECRMGCILGMRRFTHSARQTQLTNLAYVGQSMDEDVAEFEPLSAKLDTANKSMDEGLLITLILESFCSKTGSNYGAAIAAWHT